MSAIQREAETSANVNKYWKTLTKGMTLSSISPNLSKHWRFLAFWLSLCFRSCLLFLVCHDTAFLFSTRAMTALAWPKFGDRWISRIGSLRFWWISVQRKALMRTMCSRGIFTKKCRQQQISDSDLKGAWHYNHMTFPPIAKNFMLYCRLIYMLSILCVRLTIKVKLGIPESFKVGWYPLKKTGSSHLNCCC